MQQEQYFYFSAQLMISKNYASFLNKSNRFDFRHIAWYNHMVFPFADTN